MENYLGDLKKTERLVDLCKIPYEKRDENWVMQFLASLTGASFKSVDPHVINGPDGFPYFQLFFPSPGENFQCFVIEKMLSYLLENGCGIVINPDNQNPDWVLTYGDILNLYLTESIYTKDHNFTDPNENNEVLFQPNTEMFVGEPAETILPKITRNLLKEVLIHYGIPSPKVLLITHKVKGETKQDLAFNITADNFKSKDEFQNFMGYFSWYFPMHYSIIAVSEKDFPGQFFDL